MCTHDRWPLTRSASCPSAAPPRCSAVHDSRCRVVYYVCRAVYHLCRAVYYLKDVANGTGLSARPLTHSASCPSAAPLRCRAVYYVCRAVYHLQSRLLFIPEPSMISIMCTHNRRPLTHSASRPSAAQPRCRAVYYPAASSMNLLTPLRKQAPNLRRYPSRC